jgi:tetratricopeptide (TPR) repeat protein
MMPESPMQTTLDTSANAEGALDQTSVPLLLAEAWRDRRSGWLQLSRGQCERRIEVQDGSPTAIESSLEDDSFALALEDSGLITPEDRIKIEKFAQDRETSQTSAVLALQILDVKSLYKAIRSSTRNQICETFEWQTGQYRWSRAGEREASPGKPHDILKLLQEQLPRRWGSDRLFASLMPDSEFYGDISPRFRRVAEKLASAGEHAQRAIARLDGSVPVGQILGECAGDPLAAATLWTLIHSGIMRVKTDRRSLENAPSEIQFEFEVTAAPSPTARAGRSTASTAKPAATTKADATSEALRAEIQTLLEQLSNLDHYNALGLGANAKASDIKRAYFKAAKKFHPDALARLGLEDLREDAARVFGRIAEAFETLSDPSKKAAYDAGGSDAPEIDTARLAQAETSFRKGEILIGMGNFHGALDYLEPAVDLWPDEPAYQSGLGWALYKQPQTDAARAREHLEIASSQAPDDAVILFRLGTVLRAMGESESGDAMIGRARKIDPAVEE